MSSKTTLTSAKVVDMVCGWGEADKPRPKVCFEDRRFGDGGEHNDALGRGGIESAETGGQSDDRKNLLLIPFTLVIRRWLEKCGSS